MPTAEHGYVETAVQQDMEPNGGYMTKNGRKETANVQTLVKAKQQPRKRLPKVAKPKGLGDTLHNIIAETLKLGPRSFEAHVAVRYEDEDCGCGGRQNRLNELWPYEEEDNVSPKR